MSDLEAQAATSPSLPTRSATVSGVRVKDEAVLYDDVSRRLHLLNPTAALIWFACDGHTKVTTLVAELACTYRTDRRRVAEDVALAIRDLADLGLVSTSVAGRFP